MKYVNDVKLNYILMNCLSLKMKLSSLAENFKTNKCSFIITNETWFRRGDSQLKKYLENLEDKWTLKQ